MTVKRENVKLFLDERLQGGQDLTHVMVPCRIGDERRLAQFRECAKVWPADCRRGALPPYRILVGVSSHDETLRQGAVDIMRNRACSSLGGSRRGKSLSLLRIVRPGSSHTEITVSTFCGIIRQFAAFESQCLALVP